MQEAQAVGELLVGAAAPEEARRSQSFLQLSRAEQERPGQFLLLLLALGANPNEQPEVRIRASLHCRNVWKRAWSKVPTEERPELLTRLAKLSASHAEEAGAHGFPHLQPLLKAVAKPCFQDWGPLLPQLSDRLAELLVLGGGAIDGVPQDPVGAARAEIAGPLLHALVKELYLRRLNKDAKPVIELLLQRLTPAWAAAVHSAGRWQWHRYMDGCVTILFSSSPEAVKAAGAQLGELFRARAKILGRSLSLKEGDPWFAKDLRCFWKGWSRLFPFGGKEERPGMDDIVTSAQLAAHTLALCGEQPGVLDSAARYCAQLLRSCVPILGQDPNSNGFLCNHAADLVNILVSCLRLGDVRFTECGEDIEQDVSDDTRACAEYALFQLLKPGQAWSPTARASLEQCGNDAALVCLARFPEIYPEPDIIVMVLRELHGSGPSLNMLKIIRLCDAVESLAFRLCSKVQQPFQKDAIQALLIVLEDPRPELPLAVRLAALDAATKVLVAARIAENQARRAVTKALEASATPAVGTSTPPQTPQTSQPPQPPQPPEEFMVPPQQRETILRTALQLLVRVKGPEAQQRCLRMIQVEAQQGGLAAAESLLARWRGECGTVDRLAQHGVLDVVHAVVRAPWTEEPPPEALIRAGFEIVQECLTQSALSEFHERGQQLLLGLVRAAHPIRDGLVKPEFCNGLISTAMAGPAPPQEVLDDAKSVVVYRDFELRWSLLVEAVTITVCDRSGAANGRACTQAILAICEATSGMVNLGPQKLPGPLQWKLLHGVLGCMLLPHVAESGEFLGIIPELGARWVSGQLPHMAAVLLPTWQQRHPAHFLSHCPADLAAAILEGCFDNCRSFPVRCVLLHTVLVVLRREGEKVVPLPVLPRFFQRCVNLLKREKGDKLDCFFLPCMPGWPCSMYGPGTVIVSQPIARRLNAMAKHAILPPELPEAVQEKPNECAQALRTWLLTQVASYVRTVPGVSEVLLNGPPEILELLDGVKGG